MTTKDINSESLELHKRLKGVLTVTPKGELNTREELSLYYTPGVGAVSSYIAEHPHEAKDYLWSNNLVAVVSDGSAVLGLGDIGPEAAMPVMEGKSMIFKHFGRVDAVPIVLDVHTADEIVAAVKAIAPSFGGINLEDIAAPKCFEIEERLKKELTIPIMHDDQHGTAIVVLAGLMNAMKVVGKSLSDTKIVLMGAGAAGVAVARLLHDYANPNIVAVDSKGVVSPDRDDLNPQKKLLASFSHGTDNGRTIQDALKGADIFVGVSVGNLLTRQDIALMNKDAVVVAMANPIPEIYPDEARAGGAKVVATGRSDFPNQVNNALAFPGIFRGALDHKVKAITEQHKVAAAKAIAEFIPNPTPDTIIPSIFAEGLADKIASVIK
ncbi:MAG TPA: NADP-dependent malic enzyme [Candidatus Saccharimonadales bacterium]|nr:NADP-dependent malic enzyme [Candidatus Saccharimonadales bacterium]